MLDYYLGRMYASDLLGKGNHGIIKGLFRERCAKGSQLEKEARDRLSQLNAVKQRCFISRKHLEYLNAVLN